jgi:hypothetical protein
VALTFTLALGSSQTGLAASLRAALIDHSEVIHATERDISTGFIDLTAGNYIWPYSPPSGYAGAVVFYTGTLGAATDFDGVTVKAIADAAPDYPQSGDAYLVAIEALALLSSGVRASFSGAAPAAGGTVEVVIGDDRTIAGGNPLSWTISTGMDLITLGVTLYVYRDSAESYGLLYSVVCDVTEIEANKYLVRAELSALLTAQLKASVRHKYEGVVLAPRRITIFRGLIKSTE